MRIRSYLVGIVGLAFVTTSVAGCGRANPLDEVEEWDLVYISDSSGWGVADRFAANIERDTGKTVRVHDYAVGELPALKVLDALRSDPGSVTSRTLASLQADVADAEVIVFFANPRGDPARGGVTGGLEECFAARKPGDCTPELYEPYVENLKAIYAQIFALREGKPTIVRAVDFCNPLISNHRRHGVEGECTRCFETFNGAVRQAAEAYGVPLISIFDAFNGPHHDEDPREKGYIRSDGIHPSEQGQQAIADLLSQAGYRPVER